MKFIESPLPTNNEPVANSNINLQRGKGDLPVRELLEINQTAASLFAPAKASSLSLSLSLSAETLSRVPSASSVGKGKEEGRGASGFGNKGKLAGIATSWLALRVFRPS